MINIEGQKDKWRDHMRAPYCYRQIWSVEFDNYDFSADFSDAVHCDELEIINLSLSILFLSDIDKFQSDLTDIAVSTFQQTYKTYHICFKQGR